MNTKATERFDVYQAITDQIIIAIEAGTGPVEMPWHRSEAGVTRPMNVDQDRRIHRNNLQQAAPALGTRLSRTGRLRSQSPATTARDTRRNSQPGELLLIIVSPKGGHYSSHGGDSVALRPMLPHSTHNNSSQEQF